MRLEEILSVPLEGSCVVIGIPASGKTFLGNKLVEQNSSHLLLSTDSYMGTGYERDLYPLIEDLRSYPKEIIIEGVLGYRLLRKGLQEDDFCPDLVIVCETNKKKQAEIYAKERDPKKLQYMKSFEIGLMKVYNDYMMLKAYKKAKTEIIIFENNY